MKTEILNEINRYREIMKLPLLNESVIGDILSKVGAQAIEGNITRIIKSEVLTLVKRELKAGTISNIKNSPGINGITDKVIRNIEKSSSIALTDAQKVMIRKDIIKGVEAESTTILNKLPKTSIKKQIKKFRGNNKKIVTKLSKGQKERLVREMLEAQKNNPNWKWADWLKWGKTQKWLAAGGASALLLWWLFSENDDISPEDIPEVEPVPETDTDTDPTPVVDTRRYSVCNGTYTLWCKSPVIYKVQGCIGVKQDGFFGPKTNAALEAKGFDIGFTDNDVNKLCKPNVAVIEPEFNTQPEDNTLPEVGADAEYLDNISNDTNALN